MDRSKNFNIDILCCVLAFRVNNGIYILFVARSYSFMFECRVYFTRRTIFS